MARAFSEDLRSRDLKAASDGTSARQAAARFGVGMSAAIRWIARAKLGERTARSQGLQRASRLDAHGVFIVGMIEAQKDITLDEMVSRLDTEAGIPIGRSALGAWLRRQGWTFKNVWLVSPASTFLEGCSVCANVSDLGAVIVPGQDGASARTDPHKDTVIWRHFFGQDVGTPFDCQAIFPIHSQTTTA